VDVDVDEAGCEVEAGDVDGLLRRVGGDGWLDGGDLAVADGNVEFGIDVILRIDDVAVAEDEIVLLGMRTEGAKEECGSQDSEHGWQYSQRKQ
jgi:hypothetical protein